MYLHVLVHLYFIHTTCTHDLCNCKLLAGADAASPRRRQRLLGPPEPPQQLPQLLRAQPAAAGLLGGQPGAHAAPQKGTKRRPKGLQLRLDCDAAAGGSVVGWQLVSQKLGENSAAHPASLPCSLAWCRHSRLLPAAALPRPTA